MPARSPINGSSPTARPKGGSRRRSRKRSAAVLLLLAALGVRSLPAGAAGAAPVASGDRYTVKAGKHLQVPRPGVLANDADPEKDRLTAVLTSSPTGGTLDLRSNGSFRYTPTIAGGTDSFTYRAFDGTSLSNRVRVVIKVDSRPVAATDAYGVTLPGPLTVAAPGVLANDRDVDGDRLVAELVKTTSHGQLRLRANGSFVYTPGARFRRDFFLYRALDGTQKSGPTRVDLRVQTANSEPVAVDDYYVVQENSPLSVPAPGILENDTDADGDALEAEVLGAPYGPEFDFYPDGSFHYLMWEDWDTDTWFTYRVSDGVSVSAPATVYIDIVAVNTPPFGEDDIYEVESGQTLDVPAPGVLANDYDPSEGDNVHVHDVVTGPGHGTLTLRTDGSFTYTPEPGFVGRDGFTYRPADSGVGNVTFVYIEVYEPSS